MCNKHISNKSFVSSFFFGSSRVRYYCKPNQKLLCIIYFLVHVTYLNNYKLSLVSHAYMKVCSLYCRKKFKTRVSGLICNFSVFGFQTLDVAVLNYLFILNSFYFFPKFFFHFFPIYERKSIGSRQGSSQSLMICLRVNFPWC